MNELIKIESKDGELLVSARDLHKGLILDEGKSERFSQWFNRYLKYGFEENIDYMVCKKIYAANQYGGEKELEDYALKIDMAKEICMLQRSEKGRQCRKYFIECEKQLKENKLQLTRKEEVQLKLFSNDSMEVVNAHKELVQIEIQEATKPLYKEINHKEDVIVGLVENIDLSTKRQRIKQIINHNANGRFSERYGLLYKEFQDKYHIDIKRRMNNLEPKSIITNKEGKDVKITNKIKTNQMEYIDKILCMTPQLYEIACKVFENDVEELMKEWKNII